MPRGRRRGGGRPPAPRPGLAKYQADHEEWQRRQAELAVDYFKANEQYELAGERFRRNAREGLDNADMRLIQENIRAEMNRAAAVRNSINAKMRALEEPKYSKYRHLDPPPDAYDPWEDEREDEPDRDASELVEDPEPGEANGRGEPPVAGTGTYVIPRRKRLTVSSFLLTFNTNHKDNGFVMDNGILNQLKGEFMAKVLQFSKWKTNRPENRGMYSYHLMSNADQEKCRQFIQEVHMFMGEWEGVEGDPNRKNTTRVHVHALFNVYHWQYYQLDSQEVHAGMVFGKALGRFSYFNFNLLANDFAAYGYILKAGQILNKWAPVSNPTRLLTDYGDKDRAKMATPLPGVIIPVSAPHSGIDTSSAAAGTRAEGRAAGNTSTLPPGTIPAFGPPVPLYPEASSRPAAPQPAPGGNAQPARIGIRGTAASHGDPNR